MTINRLTEINILHGVKRANIFGHHDRKGLGIKIKPSRLMVKEKGRLAYLNRNEVDIMEWDGANADRRGKKSKLEYLGKEPVLWSKNEFNNKMGGGRAMTSGFAAGGDFNSFKINTIENSGKANINSFNPSPFKLDLNRSSKKINKKKSIKTKKVVNQKVSIKIKK
jgi:hypothetical protein